MAKPDVPSPAIIGISAGENIHIRINGHIIDVPHAMVIDLHFCSVRSYPYNSPAQHGQFSAFTVCCPMEPKITNRDIDPTVNAHSNTIGSVVSAAALQKFRRTDVFYKGLG